MLLINLQAFVVVAVVSIPTSWSFIVGGCVGPKSVLERHLNDKQRSELRKLVHTKFDGSNSEQVLEEVNRFVFGHITEEQWHSIIPEIAEYQAKKHECSLYAQLLPKPLFKQLLQSVHRASEMGASKYDVKRLVDDYVTRLAKAGVLPDVIDQNPTMPRVVLPESRIGTQGYRNTPPKWPKKMGKLGKKIHPTLITFPSSSSSSQKIKKPIFPIARPSPYDLRLDYEDDGRSDEGPAMNRRRRINHHHRTEQQSMNYQNNQYDRCYYYAGPCATSF